MTPEERKNMNFMKYDEKEITIPVYHFYPFKNNFLEDIKVKVVHKEYVVDKRTNKRFRYFDKDKLNEQLLSLGFLNVTKIGEESIKWSGMNFTFPEYICIKIETEETSMPVKVKTPAEEALESYFNIIRKAFR